MPLGHLDRGQPVRRLAGHGHVRLRLEHHPEPGPDQLLVVHQDDPDAHAGSSASGSRATTSYPPPGRGPIRTEPP